MKKVTDFLGEFDGELIAEVPADEMADPQFPESEQSVGNSTPQGDEGDDLGFDPFINVEIILPHGDHNELAQVISRKHDADGLLIGHKHQNPILDSHVYNVHFPDGNVEAVAYNLIAEHLYSQVDEEGNQYRLFLEIVDHRKNTHAIDKTDQYRVQGNKQYKKKTTAGWELEVEWRDGGTSWIPLKELKETSPVEVTKYAVANKISDEPAFDWWVMDVLHRQDRLIKGSVSHHHKSRYKYGICLPNSTPEALQLDKEDGTDYWINAIEKEMKNNRIAFDILAEDASPPIGYKHIPLHMIYDIKMDFTRKARLVAGGHKTDPPKTMTYLSVMSRESVCIALLVAALNDLDLMAADIGNVYLNAKTEEKVYSVCGPEFGKYKGHYVVIVWVLYGLKSAGASWHAHLAGTLCTMNFRASKADPDVWM